MSFMEPENTLPSREEVEAAKPALEELERRLEELRTAAAGIEREIAVKKAWAAPVRRLPEDALALIFTECARNEWDSPLVLGAVCCRWRRVLANTPRAWAFLEITPASHHFNPQLLDLWLSRCGILKLHISLHPLALPTAVEVVTKYGRNLECLSFFNNSRQLLRSFPELKELRLGSENRYLVGSNSENRQTIQASEVLRIPDYPKSQGSLLSVERFPHLRSLHLHGPSSTVMRFISRSTFFPPLQSLHIHMNGKHWLRIIQNCAETLVSLVLEVGPTNEVSKHELQSPTLLPCLREMGYHRFIDGFSGRVPVPLLRTPVLESYKEANSRRTSPTHLDISSVTRLLLVHPRDINWTAYLSITHLRYQDTPGDIVDEMEALATDVSLCPNLSFIQCVPAFMLVALDVAMAISTEVIRQRIQRTGKQIQYHYISSKEELDANPGNFMCYTYCSCDSPDCSQQNIYEEMGIYEEEQQGWETE